jgi:branched-chain amino acid transport system substrate-binding protein
MKNPARVVLAGAAAGVTMLATGCSALPAWPSSSTPDPVVIGVDLNLTGRGPEPGPVFHDALQLQLDQLNQLNAQSAAGAAQLALEVHDNRGDAGTSAANLAELAADPAVAAIITAGCPQCVIDTAGALTVPVISLDSLAAVAAPADQRRWVFRLGPNAGDNADALSLAMAGAGAETVGLITVADPYGDEGRQWVTDAADRDGLAVVVEARVSPGDEESVSAAAQTVAGWQPPPDAFATQEPTEEPGGEPTAGPDAVVVWAYAPLAASVATGLREAGYDRPLFVDMVGADDLFLTGEATAFDGATLVFTNTPVADQRIASSPALAARQTWMLDYAARYGTYHLHSSWGADALLVLADAIRRAGGADRAAIRDRLESTRMDGRTGQLRFSGDQHSGLSPGALVTLTASGDRWQ